MKRFIISCLLSLFSMVTGGNQVMAAPHSMLVFAHRGSKGTHPENTLSAFREAIRVGADGIELDVHLTRDGEVIVIHDETIERTTNGRGFVKNYTLAQLKTFDAGSFFDKKFKDERIPTLEEVLQLVAPTNMHINIELKNDVFRYEGLEEKCIALVRKYGVEDRVIFSSFNHKSIEHLKELGTTAELALLYDRFTTAIFGDLLAKNSTSFHPNVKRLTKEIVNELLSNNIFVRPYTVNLDRDILKMHRFGVHAIFTDFPERARSLLHTQAKQ